MRCNDCIWFYNHDKTCSACRQMQAEGSWVWEIDNGNRLIRCPDCGGAMVFPDYQDKNHYRFCPYCGKQRIQGEQISMF